MPQKVLPATGGDPRLNTQTLLQLQKHKVILSSGFFLSCLWNLAAPIKAWALSRYGFASTSTTLVTELDWNTVINGRFLTALYEASGIALSAPLEKTRYINVFLDFMITPRSQLVWAESFAGSAGIFQMDIDGVMKRLSLNGTREVAQFNRDVVKYGATGFPLWGSEVIYDYVPPVTTNVALQEVSEAVLCLKGLPPEDLVNLVYPSALLPYNRTEDAQAINTWRARIFPDLPACMARRAELMASAASPGDAVIALAQELAAKYDLGLVNIAGHNLLYKPLTFWDGFIDVSGYKSGSVTYQLSGRDPSGVITSGSGHLDAIMDPRETVWWCTLQYVNPVTLLNNATECFDKVATTLPSFFLGKYLTLLAGNRYNDNSMFKKLETTNKITAYAYKTNVVTPLAKIEHAAQGNLSAWKTLFHEYVAELRGEPVVTTNALQEMCFVADGCFSACMNTSASGGNTLTYMRGGQCVSSVDTIAHGLVDLYADKRCFGSGTSQIQITYQSLAGTTYTVVANNTAGPMAILACLVGGRPPTTEFPTYLIDMLAQGTQASLVMTKTDGSETTVLNFIALLSLAGYIYFFTRIAFYLRKTYRWMKKMPVRKKKSQLVFSIINCSISNVIWSHYNTSMRCIGFLSFVEWHIGATQNHCKWADSITDISVDASYECALDVYGHFASPSELLRLAAYSWVFFALVFMDRMPGIAIEVKGYAVAATLLGLVPVSVLAMLVAQICNLRASVSELSWIHNQLWLALVWLVVMALLRTTVFRPYFALVIAVLNAVGIQQQPICKSSPYYRIIGKYYWCATELLRDEAMTYVPLSVLMETRSIEIGNVFDHQYFVYGLMELEGDDGTLRKLEYLDHEGKVEHPPWIAMQDEYYVRIAKGDM
ncbi:hypothetical protein ACHHYP_10986 [Achlya hypogyna]|uniref:Transmembrane protein n=1 Tax=Achlya hypogyna TaxID=1202772 RepID=A0A1V9YK45_ACHHY|nr:hypothetical protein ACHHYP_10986 [Achlya hypogyna]